MPTLWPTTQQTLDVQKNFINIFFLLGPFFYHSKNVLLTFSVCWVGANCEQSLNVYVGAQGGGILPEIHLSECEVTRVNVSHGSECESWE